MSTLSLYSLGDQERDLECFKIANESGMNEITFGQKYRRLYNKQKGCKPRLPS